MTERWYQVEAINSIYNYFAVENGNPVIAMPTGTGKSHVISGFIKGVFSQWHTQRFMILTHVKELIQQDLNKLIEAWPMAPVGVYSAGLKRKEFNMPITFGGVASVANAVGLFGHIDMLIIDECHLLSENDDSMYLTIISELKKVNPYLKVVGLSATPFRTGVGLITEGKIFTHICYDLTGIEAFNRLIAEGYLCQLIPRPTNTTLNVSNVGIQKGDYKQGELQRAVNRDDVTYAALQEAIQLGEHRGSWLVFSSGIEHSERISDGLNSMGIPSSYVHSKITDTERAERIDAFKAGRLRALVNNNVLTTGFDHPAIDMIICLRPTISPVLWVQMLGRGTRPWHTKDNCLVLDFAGNTKKLGPINDPVIPLKKGDKPGSAPIKTCEHCKTYNHISVRFCVFCGIEFNFAVKIEQTASSTALIVGELPIVETLPVRRVIINRHEKAGSLPTMEVSYYCEGFSKTIKEFICLEHSGFPGNRARAWWRQRHYTAPPEKTDIALQYISELRAPKAIKVHVNKKYPEVLGYEW